MNVSKFSTAAWSILCVTLSLAASASAQNRGYSSTQTFNTAGSSKDEGEPNHCGERGGASEWYTYTAPASGTLTVTTDGSDFDTVLAVYTGPGFDFATLTKKGCNNSPGKGGDKVVIPGVTANTIFYIAVDGVGGARGNVRLNMKISSAPVIISQPASKTIKAGANVTFNVTATGSDLSYQWRHKGTNLNGATKSTFTMTNVQTNLAGNYRVIVSNAVNAVMSSPVVLTVEPVSPPAKKTP